MHKDSGDHEYIEPKVYRPEPIQYDDGLETNLYEIAKQICSRPAQPPCTICLVMDHDLPSDSDLNNFEFDLLKTFTMACLKLLFGNDVNPFKLFDWELDKLQEYINSIGYTLLTEIQETETSKKFIMSFKRYGSRGQNEPNPLAHLKKYMQP
jgi:hypothetical protein